MYPKGRRNHKVPESVLTRELNVISNIATELITTYRVCYDLNNLEDEVNELYTRYCESICIHSWNRKRTRNAFIGCCFYKCLPDKILVKGVFNSLDIKIKDIQKFKALLKK